MSRVFRILYLILTLDLHFPLWFEDMDNESLAISDDRYVGIKRFEYLGYKSSLNDLLQELLKIVQLLIWFKINSLIRDFKLEQSQPIH